MKCVDALGRAGDDIDIDALPIEDLSGQALDYGTGIARQALRDSHVHDLPALDEDTCLDGAIGTATPAQIRSVLIAAWGCLLARRGRIGWRVGSRLRSARGCWCAGG